MVNEQPRFLLVEAPSLHRLGLRGQIANRALVKLEEWNVTDVANSVWAFAMLNVCKEVLLSAIVIT